MRLVGSVVVGAGLLVCVVLTISSIRAAPADVAAAPLSQGRTLLVDGVPIKLMQEVARLCVLFGADGRYGSSCFEARDPAVEATGIVLPGDNAVVVGRVPHGLIETVQLTSGGRHVAARLTQWDDHLMFVVELPGGGSWTLRALTAAGAVWAEGDLDIDDDSTTSMRATP